MAQLDGTIASNTPLCDRSAPNFTPIPSSGALPQDQILYSPDMSISRHASGYALHGSKARTASASNRPANPTRPQQCPASAQAYHNGQQVQSLRPLVGIHNSQAQQIFQNAQQHYTQYHSLPSVAGESPGSSRMGAVSTPATTSALRPASSSWRAVFEESGMQLVSSTPAHNYGNSVNGPTSSELGALSTYEKAATFSNGTGRSGTTELSGSIPGPLLDTSFAYCYDRGNGQFTRLIPADMLPELRDIPRIEHTATGMIVLPQPAAELRMGVVINGRPAATKVSHRYPMLHRPSLLRAQKCTLYPFLYSFGRILPKELAKEISRLTFLDTNEKPPMRRIQAQVPDPVQVRNPTHLSKKKKKKKNQEKKGEEDLRMKSLTTELRLGRTILTRLSNQLR